MGLVSRPQGALHTGRYGNPLACAAGLAALESYEDEKLIERAAGLGEHLLGRLHERLDGLDVVREIRGLGLMVGIELRQKPGPYLKALMDDHGVLALPARTNVLRRCRRWCSRRPRSRNALTRLGRYWGRCWSCLASGGQARTEGDRRLKAGEMRGRMAAQHTQASSRIAGGS